MEKIVLKRQSIDIKPRRSSVVVKPETYVKVYTLARELNMPMETLVDTLLREALNAVEIEE